MKICVLCDKYPPDIGGLAVSVRRQCQGLSAAGHEIHMVAPDEASALGAWHSQPDGMASGDSVGKANVSSVGQVIVHRFGANGRPREVLTDWFEGVVALDGQQGFDLFQGYFLAYAGFMAAYLARALGRRSVVSARGNDIDVMPFDFRRAAYVFKALEWADGIIAVTHDIARKAAALSGRQDIAVIHNGVDSGLFRPLRPDPGLRADLGLDERPVIGFTGEARAKKGLGPLLRLFARLSETTPAQLLLIGGVRERDQPLVDYFRRNHPHLPLHIIPTLPNHQMPPYYALLDLVLLPSLRDGLPNTLLEAMACGRPVVASAVGGMPEVITDGRDGLLLPARDDQRWLETVTRLLADQPAREQLGAAARQTIIRRFSPDREVAQLLALYDQLQSSVKSGPGPPTARPSAAR